MVGDRCPSLAVWLSWAIMWRGGLPVYRWTDWACQGQLACQGGGRGEPMESIRLGLTGLLLGVDGQFMGNFNDFQCRLIMGKTSSATIHVQVRINLGDYWTTYQQMCHVVSIFGSWTRVLPQLIPVSLSDEEQHSDAGEEAEALGEV